MGVGHCYLPRFKAEVEAKRLGLTDQAVGVYEQGRVVSLNTAAEMAGLVVGMRLRETYVVTHDVRLVSGLEDRYQEPWRAVLDVCATHVSVLEPAELGRAFFDTSGPWTPGELLGRIGHAIEAEAWHECRVGGGPNKLIARMATEIAPGGDVHLDDVRSFLAPLSIDMLWPVDEADIAHLRALGILTIEQLQEIHEVSLAERFGDRARRLKSLAWGIDPTPVEALYPPRWVQARILFPDGGSDGIAIEAALRQMACELSKELCARDEACRRLVLEIDREGSFETMHTLTLKSAVWRAGELEFAVRRLAQEASPWADVVGLTLRAHELSRATHEQLNLFARRTPPARRRDQILHTLAHAQARFGSESVHLGSMMSVPRRERVLAGLA